MDLKKLLKKQFLETVDNQLRSGDPPETAGTLHRLMEAGYSEAEARELISTCVAAELMAVVESNEPFNRERYVRWLSRLPELPE